MKLKVKMRYRRRENQIQGVVIKDRELRKCPLEIPLAVGDRVTEVGSVIVRQDWIN